MTKLPQVGEEVHTWSYTHTRYDRVVKVADYFNEGPRGHIIEDTHGILLEVTWDEDKAAWVEVIKQTIPQPPNAKNRRHQE
jgi:hypothetical protein